MGMVTTYLNILINSYHLHLQEQKHHFQTTYFPPPPIKVLHVTTKNSQLNYVRFIRLIAGDNVGMIDYNIWPHLERLYNLHKEGDKQILGEFKTK